MNRKNKSNPGKIRGKNFQLFWGRDPDKLEGHGATTEKVYGLVTHMDRFTGAALVSTATSNRAASRCLLLVAMICNYIQTLFPRVPKGGGEHRPWKH